MGELVGQMLRHWRGRLTREDIGLPSRLRRRRSGGLTQEDVAEAVGYGLRTYVDLEHGGRGRPSADLLELVADVLRLDAGERRALWVTATGTSRPAQSYATDPDAGLTQLCEQMACPAYVTDAAWQVLAANRAVAQWFVDFGSVPVDDRNVAKWIFGNVHSQHAFVDWPRFADEFVARFRALYAPMTRNPGFLALLEDLLGYPEFAARWATTSVISVDPPTARRRFREPGTDLDDPGVPLDMVILAAVAPEDGRRVVVFQFPPEYTPPAPSADTAPDRCPACARLRT
ncbi:helix-turn-helix domain-containing protein [Micromonospora sp. Llam7]|uniref:helix-turn-helix domain-containing protein n=1 Tax=Micromonospora tarapacensis TaxID=2835305 RepID=UPI001C838B83|nr:helix-turn-helix domain-containing protein [Micromonospora tarapacensis]MBX7266991.1 helix-turn-helix domain-containing protein [Micromonospora tarapacensis]